MIAETPCHSQRSLPDRKPLASTGACCKHKLLSPVICAGATRGFIESGPPSRVALAAGALNFPMSEDTDRVDICQWTLTANSGVPQAPRIRGEWIYRWIFISASAAAHETVFDHVRVMTASPSEICSMQDCPPTSVRPRSVLAARRPASCD